MLPLDAVLHFLVSFFLVVSLIRCFTIHPCTVVWFVLVLGFSKEIHDWTYNPWHMARVNLFWDCLRDMTANVIGATLGFWCSSKEIE